MPASAPTTDTSPTTRGASFPVATTPATIPATETPATASRTTTGAADAPAGTERLLAGRGRAASRETIHHPSADALDLALVLRTVGDPLRLGMVRALADGEELLCGALGERLGLPKSTSSYHLRLLREAGLTRTRQDGTLRFISLRRADLDARFPGLVDVLMADEAG